MTYEVYDNKMNTLNSIKNTPMLIPMRGSFAFLRVAVLLVLGLLFLGALPVSLVALTFSLGASSFIVFLIGLLLLYPISIYESECFVVAYFSGVLVH